MEPTVSTTVCEQWNASYSNFARPSSYCSSAVLFHDEQQSLQLLLSTTIVRGREALLSDRRLVRQVTFQRHFKLNYFPTVFFSELYSLASNVRPLPTTFVYQLHSLAGYFRYKMKHLDVIDGEIAGVPQDQRPAPCIIGQNLVLLYLKLRLSDAETWMAYTATPCQSPRLCVAIKWISAAYPL